jgi:hypothetical protein
MNADHCYGMTPYNEEALLLSGLNHQSDQSVLLEILAYKDITSATSSNDFLDAKTRKYAFADKYLVSRL